MGLNSIRNPAKLRRIASLIGEVVTYAASRYFEPQTTLIAFGASGRCYAVDVKRGTAEEHNEKGRTLQPFIDTDGVARGVRSVPWPVEP